MKMNEMVGKLKYLWVDRRCVVGHWIAHTFAPSYMQIVEIEHEYTLDKAYQKGLEA